MPYIGNPIYQSAFVTDQFSGDGTTTAFTMSVAPAGVSNVLVAVSGVLQDPSTYGVAGTTITFSTAPPSGTGNISCRYLGVPVTGITTTAYRTVTEFTATAGQTTFTPPSYTPSFINVYLNGVLLGSADYTATNGTTVVLATGAAVGNLVTIESFQVSSVLNAIPNTAGAVSSSNIQTSPTLTTPTIDKINTSVTNTSLGAGNASIMKNRIINGAMVIDQRNAGASVNADGSYTLDRWRASTGAANKFSVQQNAGSITPPVGFVNYIGLTSTATTTPSGADEYSIEQFIEGYNISDLGFGTANAKTVTLSFWVRSSLTGTFGGVIGNGSNNRSYVYSYTISAANTWEQKSITITGDTSGTWLTTTGRGMRLSFSLGCGSTVTTAAGSWQAGYYVNPTGGVNVVGTNGATFYITGVQLEVGSSATGFEYRMYGTELANCQRYYWQQSGIASTVTTIGSGMVYASNDIRCSVQNPVTMRTTPTIAFTGSAFEYERAGTSRGTLSTLNSTGRSADSSVLYSGSGTTAGTSGDGAIWYLTNSGSNFGVSAEL